MRRALRTRAGAVLAVVGLVAAGGVASAPPASAEIYCHATGLDAPGATITVGDQDHVVGAMSDIHVCYGAAAAWDNPPGAETRENCGTPCFVIDLDFDSADNFGFSVGYYWTDENGDYAGDYHGNPYFPLTSPVPVCIAVGNPRPTC